jgi:hypothetical protein
VATVGEPDAENEIPDDPFVDYDIESGSEKDFLITSIKYAPVEEVQEIRRASQGSLPGALSPASKWDTAMTLRKFKEKISIATVSAKYIAARISRNIVLADFNSF